MTRRLAIVAGVMLIATACARPSSEREILRPEQQGDPSAPPEHGEGGFTDWDNPIDGVEITPLELQEGQGELPFVPITPLALGPPQRILVSSPESTRELRLVAFVYDSAIYDRVVVIERLPEVAPSEYDAANESWVAQANDPELKPDVKGTSAITTLRRGNKAMITASSDGKSDIRWLEGAVEILVRGPNLSRAQVIEIAEIIFIPT